MIKEVTFSRTFPATHFKKGQPTYFVEKVLTQLGIKYKTGSYYKWLIENNPEINPIFLLEFFDSLKKDVSPKKTTIRNHKKPLNVGDFIRPTCWAGKPYKKTESGYWKIKFAPNFRVVKTWSFAIDNNLSYTINGKILIDKDIARLAINDGLNAEELKSWFTPNGKKPIDVNGKIICWDDYLEY